MYGVPDYTGFAYPGGYQQSRYGVPNMQYIGQPTAAQNGVLQQQAPAQSANVAMIKCRPVSNFKEAEASMIDLDGSMHVFTDIANKRIYTKRCLLDGSAELKTYVLEEPQMINEGSNMIEQQMQGTDYVSRNEFDKVLKQINKRFDDMEGIVNVSNTKNDANV